jgi:peptidyl-prolyl cis-trans isomerase A (cyclophilin A)
MADNPQVVLETSYGNIEIELYEEQAPTTVDNFLDYVDAGFYDNTIFHRVIPGFMVQGGGFIEGGSQKETNPPIILESDNGLKNEKGTLAMARTSVPDSATAQFFINLEDNDFLDYSQNNPGYAVFGRVTSGMEVVDQIAQVQTENNGPHQNWPEQTVFIKKAYRK